MVKFYVCKHCQSVVAKLNNLGCAPSCCGETMVELKVGAVEAAVEKHMPVVTKNGKVVEAVVGSVAHPMVEDHYIAWIYFETSKGGAFRFLKAGDAPKASYTLDEDEELVEVYAYCNKHGLWASAK